MIAINYDAATGLHVATDGTYLLTARDGGKRVCHVVDTRKTQDLAKMTPCGEVDMSGPAGSHTWIRVCPNRALLDMSDVFYVHLVNRQR